MKPLGKIRDRAAGGAMDNLLRAYVSRPANRACSEFDADLANAYIERGLTPAAQSRYEQHLSECSPCRKNVVALSRLAGPELRSSITADAGVARRSQVFGLSSWPRWAMAATAVIVIAISVPLLLTRKAAPVPQDSALALNESQSSDNRPAAGDRNETSSTPAAKVPAASPATSPEPKPADRARSDAVSSNGQTPAQQPAASSGERASSSEPAAAKPAIGGAAQSKVSSGAQPASEVASAQTQTKQADTQGVEKARQQQQSKDAEADAKSTASEPQETKKEQVVDRVAAVPPPAPPPVKTESVKNEKLKHSAGRLALRDSNSADAVRLTEKTVSGKKFTLKSDTWTDKEFDPDKDLPVVTVVRGSNVYNELLTKRAGLKKYFDGIAATERAIIVYKGTVYKLIPQ